MIGGRLPKRMSSKALRVQCGEDGVGRRKLLIAYKATALKAEMWAETVTEGGRTQRGQTSPEEQSGKETGKVVIAHGSVECCTRRTTHELTQLCCITHVSGSTTTQLCCITHPSGKYYHSVVLYNSPEWKVLPLSYVV